MNDADSGSKKRLSRAEAPSEEPKSDTQSDVQAKGQVDPLLLFEMVAKRYDSWLRVLEKQHEDTGFSPFPGSDSDHQGPKFNYQLLEALERATSAMNSDLTDISVDGSSEQKQGTIDTKQHNPRFESIQDPEISLESSRKVNECISSITSEKGDILLTQEPPIKALKEHRSREGRAKVVAGGRGGRGEGGLIGGRVEGGSITGSINNDKSSIFLKEEEIKDLQEKVFEVFLQQNKALQGALKDAGEVVSGGIQQDDYDIEEILDALYDKYRPTHHIEVELNSSKDGSKTTLFNNQGDFEDNEGPSCEFTFEYDHNGKLIPTYNNIQEKLRQMKFDGHGMEGYNEGSNWNNNSKKEKKKKKKKKKKTGIGEDHGEEDNEECLHECCLLCEYEAIYGERPRQMIKWYDQTVHKESMRRGEIRKKIENAKLMALRHQRELYEAMALRHERETYETMSPAQRQFEDHMKKVVEEDEEEESNGVNVGNGDESGG